LITRPRSPTVCVKNDYETEEEARAQQRAVEPLINELLLLLLLLLLCFLTPYFCNKHCSIIPNAKPRSLVLKILKQNLDIFHSYYTYVHGSHSFSIVLSFGIQCSALCSKSTGVSEDHVASIFINGK
jgi:hypothetical protein